MKFFTNKSIWGKVLMILVIILLFQFLLIKPVQADAASFLLEYGGKLMQPIMSLFVTLADAFLDLAHGAIMGTDATLIPMDLDTSFWEWILTFLTWVIIAVIVAASIYASWPVTVGALAKEATKLLVFKTASTLIMKNVLVGALIGAGTTTYIWMPDQNVESVDLPENISVATYNEDTELPETIYLPAFTLSPQEIFEGKILLFNVDFFGNPTKIYAKGTNESGEEVSIDTSGENAEEEIRKINLDYYYYKDPTTGGEIKTSKQNIATELSKTISRWYVAIRNIVLVFMMIVLLYIGIRMLISTLASDKAKYRQMLTDWFIGLLILFFMHYIMAFSVTIVQKITDILTEALDNGMYYVTIPADENGKMAKFLNEDKEGMKEIRLMAKDSEGNSLVDENNNDVDIDSSRLAYLMYSTNLMGQLRLQAQLSNYGTDSIGYSLCYIVMVFYTVFFIFTYLRRVLYMAFLTLIGPVVAMTYPIDKIKDGSAQGFSKWFREYEFNLLIQPMHLLLYYVLIGSAFELSSTNIIYSLVAIGFMIPAEKLLRSFFGFQKSETAGVFSGVAGAALAMGGLNKITSLGRGKGDKNKDKAGNSEGDSSKVRETNNFNLGDVDEDSTMLHIGEGARNPKDIETTETPVEEHSESTPPVLQNQQQKIQSETENKDTSQEKTDNPKEQEISTNENPKENKTVSDFTKRGLRAQRKKKLRAGKKLPTRAFYKMVGGTATTIGAAGVRGLARTIGTVGGATVGVAAGIVTGDPNKVLQYGATGTATGYMSSKSLANRYVQAPNLDKRYQRFLNRNPEIKEAEEIKNISKEVKVAKEALKDNGYTSKEVKTLEKEGTLGYYVANNIDTKDIIAIEKMRKEDKNLTAEDGVAIARYNEKFGESLSGKDRQKTIEAMSDRFREKKKVSKEVADNLSYRAANYVDKFKKAKKNVN